jgi:hypothetical protein
MRPVAGQLADLPWVADHLAGPIVGHGVGEPNIENRAITGVEVKVTYTSANHFRAEPKFIRGSQTSPEFVIQKNSDCIVTVLKRADPIRNSGRDVVVNFVADSMDWGHRPTIETAQHHAVIGERQRHWCDMRGEETP